MARMWWEVTGDSWVVDVREVSSPGGCAAYLGKYLGKSMADYRFRLLELGYLRRFQRSNNWPAVERMQFEATIEDLWEEDKQWHKDAVVLPGYLMDGTPEASGFNRFKRVGTAMAERSLKGAKRAKALERMKRVTGS